MGFKKLFSPEAAAEEMDLKSRESFKSAFYGWVSLRDGITNGVWAQISTYIIYNKRSIFQPPDLISASAYAWQAA